MNNLAGIYLNLLVTLDALLAERHVSRAAVRLNRSQPAVSHALARLRGLFDDPLLVRHGGRLEPTARALEIAPDLAETLDRMRRLLGPSDFDPAREQRSFRLAMSDYGAGVILPGLVRALRAEAPQTSLVVTQASREAMMSLVMDGEVDLAFGLFPALAGDLRAQRLFEERFACVADGAGLGRKRGLDLPAYLARPHALVALRSDVDSEIDAALAGLGHRRRVCIVLSHWAAAADVVAGTDLVLTIAGRALPADAGARLRRFDPPFAIPSFGFQQIWHRRRDGDPAHRWLRDRIAGIVRD